MIYLNHFTNVFLSLINDKYFFTFLQSVSCPAGTEHSRNGSCVPCLSGWYKAEPSIQPCDKCQGNYTSNSDQTKCSVCKLDSFSTK